MRTGDAVDGCATFWHGSRFKLLHEESIEYKKIDLRDNVAQICVFELLCGHTANSNQSAPAPSTRLDNSNRVVVCNIHVLYNPKRGDIKLGQIRVLLERAQAVSNLWDAPIVICGDFNCTPKSPVYKFISERKIDLSNLSRDKISGQASALIHHSRGKRADTWTQISTVNPTNFEATATGRADCKVMEHSLKLRSAYTEVEDPLKLRDSSGEPLATCYSQNHLCTVDYIWLSEALQAARVLAPIPKHVMQQTPGFPTKKWGSDHIALVTELAFNKKSSPENSS